MGAGGSEPSSDRRFLSGPRTQRRKVREGFLEEATPMGVGGSAHTHTHTHMHVCTHTNRCTHTDTHAHAHTRTRKLLAWLGFEPRSAASKTSVCIFSRLTVSHPRSWLHRIRSLEADTAGGPEVGFGLPQSHSRGRHLSGVDCPGLSAPVRARQVSVPADSRVTTGFGVCESAVWRDRPRACGEGLRGHRETRT